MDLLLKVSNEKQALKKELKLLKQVRYKLSSQLRHFKEFTMLRIIASKINKFQTNLITLEQNQIKKLPSLDIKGLKNSLVEVKQRIEVQGHMIRVFLRTGFLIQFSVLIYGICAKLYSILQKIEKKLDTALTIQKQMIQKKSKKS